MINEMVDTGGSTFLFRLGEETGLPVPDITRAWLVAREVFGMQAFWQQVEAMAGTVDVDARIAVVLEARKLVERATRWLLVNRRPPFGIAETVSFFGSGVATVRSAIPKLLSGSDLSGYEERRASYAGSGVPAGLADEVAAMVPSYSAFDIVTSAAATEHGVEETAAVYFLLADRLQLVPAARPDHRAAARRPLGGGGPVGAARRPVRRARRADPGRARGRPPGAALTGASRWAARPAARRTGSPPGRRPTRLPSPGRRPPWPRSGRATGSPSPPCRWRSG